MRKFLILGLALFALPAIAIPIVDISIYAGVDAMPEVVLRNAATTPLSTTRIEPFTTLIASQRTDKYLQNIVVSNIDTTGSVCLFLATYAQTCSALTNTCLGATLPGVVVPPGQSRAIRFTGNAGKVCAVASEADVNVQFERVLTYGRR